MCPYTRIPTLCLFVRVPGGLLLLFLEALVWRLLWQQSFPEEQEARRCQGMCKEYFSVGYHIISCYALLTWTWHCFVCSFTPRWDTLNLVRWRYNYVQWNESCSYHFNSRQSALISPLHKLVSFATKGEFSHLVFTFHQYKFLCF